MVGVVRRSARIAVHEAVFQRVVDEDRQFARVRGNGFRFPDAPGETSIERPEGGVRAAETHRREAQDSSGPVCRWRGA